jgi:hypothetical protein
MFLRNVGTYLRVLEIPAAVGPQATRNLIAGERQPFIFHCMCTPKRFGSVPLKKGRLLSQPSFFHAVSYSIVMFLTALCMCV